MTPFQSSAYYLQINDKKVEISLQTVFTGKDPIDIPTKPETPTGTYEQVGSPNYYAGEPTWYWWVLGILAFFGPLIAFLLICVGIFSFVLIKQPK